MDKLAQRYREMARSIADKRALDAIDEVIANFETEKLVLHPEPDK